jgi:hypothetical protein
MLNPYGVDFQQVVENAATQGIDLAEIALFYEGLTEWEILELKRHKLFIDQTSRCVIGKLNKEGIALFPDKVSSVYSLST